MSVENKVYVVDDDLSARNGLTRLLRTAGYAVQAFDSANKFLKSLGSEVSGCLVLDIRMPDMSAEELADELKQRNTNLSIIVVSGEDCAELKRKAQEIKAAVFFRKPVDGTALLDAINWSMNPSINGKDQKKKNQSNEK